MTYGFDRRSQIVFFVSRSNSLVLDVITLPRLNRFTAGFDASSGSSSGWGNSESSSKGNFNTNNRFRIY